MKPVDIAAVGVDASSGVPVVLLREREAPHRMLPIIVAPADAAAIALPATGQVSERPMTHDLLAQVLEDFGAHVDAAEVTEVREGTFLARLTFHDAVGERHLDSRPSDAIALALRAHAPVLVSEEVLAEAGTIVEDDEDETLDQQAIDEAVEEFREFLDDVDPGAFADTKQLPAPPEATGDDTTAEPTGEITDDSAGETTESEAGDDEASGEGD